jgi:hypothetical protein
MKLTLRIGRQRPKTVEADEVRVGDDPADHAQEPQPSRIAAAAAAPARVPLPRATDRRVVRAGSFCRVGEIGQTAVAETGRSVLAIRAGRCGRWVYSDPA